MAGLVTGPPSTYLWRFLWPSREATGAVAPADPQDRAPGPAANHPARHGRPRPARAAVPVGRASPVESPAGSGDSIRSLECVEYPELGMEAIWKIEVEDFPAFILVDDKGNDFFQVVTQPNCSFR